MNILYLTNIFSDTAGGSEYIFWLYAKYMAKRGHNVHVMCYKSDKESIIRLGKANDKVYVIELVPKVEHQGVLFQQILPNIEYLVKGIKKLQELRRSDIDIIHSNTYVPPLLGSMLQIKLNRPHIVTIHDVGLVMGLRFLYRWFREGGNDSFTSYLKAIMSTAYEHLMLTSIPRDAIIVPSSQTKEDIHVIFRSRRSNTKIYVVPSAIDLEIYEQYKNRYKISYDPYFLYIGRLVFYKNVHVLIKGFEEVTRENREAKLIVIGKGPLEQILRNYVRKQRLTNRIIITGYIDQEEKLRLLSRCLALVNLSIFEGFGMVLLESWYFEKPVIVSTVPPLTELVNNNMDGILVHPQNIKEIRDAMLNLLEDPAYARSLGLHGLRKVIKHYHPDRICRYLEAVYNEVQYEYSRQI